MAEFGVSQAYDVVALGVERLGEWVQERRAEKPSRTTGGGDVFERVRSGGW